MDQREKCFHFSADDQRNTAITIKQIKFKYSRVPIAKYQAQRIDWRRARRVRISFSRRKASTPHR